MKLKEYTVREFKSVWDSGPIKVDDRITCLVGKNEAGKTALLQALYRVNPIIDSDANFDETYDYPKREVGHYLSAIQNRDRDEAVVVECSYELEDDDIEAVTKILGPKVLRENIFIVETLYGENEGAFYLEVNETEARQHLAHNSKLSDDIRSALAQTTNWEEFADVLDEIEIAETEGAADATGAVEIDEKTEIVRFLKKIAFESNQYGLGDYICTSVIWPRAPKFLYFDEYYQMEGQANLNALINRDKSNGLKNSDLPLLGLIKLAQLNHEELVSTQNTTRLKNDLESAKNHLNKEIVKHWSQNQHIELRFDVRDAKPEDPEGMREGINIWGEVYDTVHMALTPLGSRSRGFVWFFSFLAWYEHIKQEGQNVILLLDEPGLSLHGRAQADLLKYFDTGLSDHQLIYSTHSPFMINPEKLEQVRIVQDLDMDSRKPHSKNQGGTRVLSNIFDATNESLFPLQGALGYEIQQTLFIGPNCLVVEGPSDMNYLRAISAGLEREGRTGLSEQWVITPVGGSGKIPTFVSLLAPQKGMNVATLLDVQNNDRPQVENLYKKNLLKKKQVITYAELIGKEEADIEDMFERPFYVGLVNAEFENNLHTAIDVTSLNPNEPRITRAIEAWIEKNPLKSGAFGHYRPARYFEEHVTDLWPDISDTTKDCFENAFKKINALLR